MKTLKAFFSLFILISFSTTSFAQTSKSATLDVAGVCGMCKKKIETAARSAGASFAAWSPDTKKLNIKYSDAASLAKIEQSVAATGYDTKNVKATEAAYNALHECCKYERTTGTAKADCCAGGTCAKDAACCKDGQCAKTADCCAQGEACCKDGACKEHKASKA